MPLPSASDSRGVMSCGPCSRPRVQTIGTPPEDVSMDTAPSLPVLSKDPWLALLDHVTMQSLQGKALQDQVQSVLAEQASLRALVKSQHEDLLQNLSLISACVSSNAGKACGGSPNVAFQVPLPPAVPQMQPLREILVQSNFAQSERTPLSSTVATSNGQKEKQVIPPRQASPQSEAGAKAQSQGRPKLDVARKAGRGVLFDISKLPQTWTVATGFEETDNERQRLLGYMHSLVQSGKFDLFFITVIFLNLITNVIQLQWRSYAVSMSMGERSHDSGWDNAKSSFDDLEVVYTSIFLVEAILRISVLGCKYLRIPANLFDTLIVLVTCLQTYILAPAGVLTDGSFVSVARLVRLVRVMRFLKVVRFAEVCSQLRILARALAGCIGSLFWSMVLLMVCIFAGSIVLFQIALTYMEEEGNPQELKKWCYETLGSISLCLLALWECTFTGSWHRYSRKMIIELSPYYAVFWVPYIICINFCVMRLIGALFLKETMSVAAIDQEKMSIAKMKRQREYADMIRTVFKEADSSGDGRISADEFEQMLYNEHVGSCFEKLELEVSEVAVLFELLCADDGQAEYDEFLQGALKLKQTAQTIDVIQLIHGSQKLGVALQTVYGEVCDVASAVGLEVDKELIHELQEELCTDDAHDMFVHQDKTKTDESKDAELDDGGND